MSGRDRDFRVEGVPCGRHPTSVGGESSKDDSISTCVRNEGRNLTWQIRARSRLIVMLGRGVGGSSNSTSYGNESFVRCRVINTLPRDSSLMDVAKLTKDRERVVINECCSQNDAFFNFGSGRLNQWRHLQASNRRETIVTEYFEKTASGRSGKV